MNTKIVLMTSVTLAAMAILTVVAIAASTHDQVDDAVIAKQRSNLAASTQGKGYGPQSPRDIEVKVGSNARNFGFSPDSEEMNLCNVHFHENAEHRGPDFRTYAGNGDGKGYGTGFKYSGDLSAAELAPLDRVIGASKHGDLQPGDTIEVHYVYTSAKIDPGPTLGSCLSDAIGNPQLRVEAQVMVLVNDAEAANFGELAKIEQQNGYFQAVGIPDDTGEPIIYAGSTTGPGYNEKGSPFHVTWSVRPQAIKVDLVSLGDWLADNPFDEDHAHGVRNLVVAPQLLSEID